MSSYSREGVYFHPASASCEWSAQESTCRWNATDLLSLAFPASLAIMRPAPTESLLPRVDHAGAGRVLRCEVAHVRLNAGNDSPPTVGSVLNVLLQGIVAFFPPIEGLIAQKACDIIWVLGERTPHKTCFRELVQVSARVPSRYLLLNSNVRPRAKGISRAAMSGSSMRPFQRQMRVVSVGGRTV